MPIMATHHPSSHGNVFYDNALNDCPESPKSRKRKQHVQYASHNGHSLEPSFYYSLNHPEQQQWHQPPSQQQQQAATFDASSLIIGFNNEAQMQASSDISSWSHQHHHSEQSVGENNGLSEIHRMLNLDQFDTNLTSAQTNYSFVGELNDLHLTDLNAGHLNQQGTWSKGAGGTTNAQQQQQQPNYSNNGSGIPGFLESLQEDDNESYHTLDVPFHHHHQNREWQASSYSSSSSPLHGTIGHDLILMPERALSSHLKGAPISTNISTDFHQNHLSVPSFPIPKQHRRHDTASTSSTAGILLSSLVASSSWNASLPPPTATPNFGAEGAAAVNHFDDNNRFVDHRRYHVMDSRLLQDALNEARMKPFIRDYLSNLYSAEERTVILLTSKVAQKSYGTEKRFLCPPPTVILVGKNWWTSSSQKLHGNNNEVLKMPDGNEFCPPKITVSISGETSIQSGQIEWYTVSGVTVGQTGHVKSQQTESPSTSTTSTRLAAEQLQKHPSRFRSSAESRNNSIDWYQNQAHELLTAGKCVFKHLYINDADEKRKRVEGLIRIQLANGIQMGALASKGIKVISKPSKKRQSVKNMELCIHHGTTVSLFNRIRSQTVSTKYLGVSSSSPFPFPGQPFQGGPPSESTCFVARTTCWDPFIIWVVDTTRSPSDAKESDTPQDFVGRNAFALNTPYPPPPAIALKNKTSQLIPIHYNQHVVLQCLTTGLVSPVMIIRKVDKASTVVGGAQSTDEYGEVLGDPVSQLHKTALQIVQDPQQQQKQHYFASTASDQVMMPRACHPATYLACINDMVGIHKTTDARKPIIPVVTIPKPNSSSSSSSSNSNSNSNISNSNFMHHSDNVDVMVDITLQETGGKIVRKRRISTDPSLSMDNSSNAYDSRRRVNSSSDDYSLYRNTPSQYYHEVSRKSSISSNGSTSTANGAAGGGRRSSVQNQAVNGLGAYWHEDVSDVAVWTIVGTDCTTYTFLSASKEMLQHAAGKTSLNNAPFPSLIHMTTKAALENKDQLQLSLHGENFSRDLQVWFGDIKASNVEYQSRELIICRVPSKNELLPVSGKIPILLVRGDGTICKTNKMYVL